MATAETTAGEVTADITAAPSPADGARGRLQQLVGNIRKLDQRQKIAAAAALALAIALVVGATLWSRAPQMAVLYSNFDAHDGGDIVTALQQQNIPYTLSDDGRSILVAPNVVHDTRLRLAAAGLPKGGMVGFELMDTQKLGTSQFNEQVTYQRALQGELARTIQSISSVVSARVHLAMPKQTAFLRDEQKPTASVLVQLRPGRFLDSNQVAGIVHLVASSVPKMSDAGVTIVDQSGTLLSGEDPLKRSGLDPTQIRYVEEIEAGLNRRIENILTPMFGKGNFSAQVTAELDFNQVEQTAETYRPNPAPEQAIRSQQSTEEQGRERDPQGVPGALTNQPPVPATAPITTPPVPPQTGPNGEAMGNKSRTAVLNYELDRTIQHIKQSRGQVKRLSVAVLINQRAVQLPAGVEQNLPVSDEEITRISNLVREAVGYNEARGDTINVTSTVFAVPEAAPALPLWKDPAMLAVGKEGGKYGLILLAVLFVYFAVVRPLVRVVALPPPREEATLAVAQGGAAGEDEQEGVDVELSEAATRAQDYDSRLERARQFARDDPKSVADLVKHWLGVSEEGAH
ncbi:MAG: flagellar M-ring protein FliF [Azoarcus sp.]|jgi:flagellar M-ring protein FliF|nr:flagellar M-ring protein FliF [Azoarcus sp.]